MIPPEVRQFIAKEYGGKPVQLQEHPIFSTVRFQATLAAGPPVVATIDTSPRVAFSYGLNQDMGPGGRAGVLATAADTNLQNPGQTRDQADVFIFGMAAFLLGQSDGALVERIWRETDVLIQTNADVTMQGGTLDCYPQPGGLTGEMKSNILIPAQHAIGGFDGGEGGKKSFASNGVPTAGSFRRFENPLFWAGQGKGSDSNLQVICTPRRSIVETCALARAAQAAGANTAGAGVYTPPTGTTVFVDVRWVLYAATVKKRGVNAG